MGLTVQKKVDLLALMRWNAVEHQQDLALYFMELYERVEALEAEVKRLRGA